jgi:hypothetical protein
MTLHGREGRSMLKTVKRHGALGTRLVAAARIARGTPFFRVRADHVRRQPTYQTVQIGPRRHTLSLGILQYINHSCEPNVIIDTKSRLCYAAREIPPREELSYFYPSTEWELARPFLCLCGVAHCIRIVTGARYLSTDTLSRYFINEHIRELIAHELTASSRRRKAQLRSTTKR